MRRRPGKSATVKFSSTRSKTPSAFEPTKRAKEPSSGITGEPNEFVQRIHTRRPVIPWEEHHDAWLSGEAGKEILVPFPAVLAFSHSRLISAKRRGRNLRG